MGWACKYYALGLGKHQIQVASNKLKIAATKSQLNSNVVANVEPASILFNKLHFVKTQE